MVAAGDLEYTSFTFMLIFAFGRLDRLDGLERTAHFVIVRLFRLSEAGDELCPARDCVAYQT